jgi:hypothetical protein
MEAKTTSANLEMTIQVTTDITSDKGTLKVTENNYISMWINSEEEIQFEVIDSEIHNINYMGIEINSWTNIKKFLEFHKEMGIDITAILVAKQTENKTTYKELIESNINLNKVEKFLKGIVSK